MTDASVNVTCNAGYSSGATRTATCESSGTFSGLAACTADACTATELANSNYASAGSIAAVTDQLSPP